MACPGCQNCNGSPVKDSLPLPVAIICDLSTGAGGCPNPDVEILNVCDATGTPYLEVILSCNGIPQSTPTYLNFDLSAATPTQPVAPCASHFAVSTETACIRRVSDDTVADTVEIVKVVDVLTGAITTLRVFSLDGTTEYTLPLPATQILGSCETSYQTLEINEVCADGVTAFRKVVKNLDNSETVTFLGTNGAVLTPVTWLPGKCGQGAPNSVSVEVVCINGGTPAFRREVIDDNDVSTVTFIGGNGVAVVPVTWIPGECLENFTDSLDDMLVCADGLPAIRHETLNELGVSTVTFIGADGVALTPVTWTPGSCSDCLQFTETIVCAAGVQLIKRTDCQGNSTFIGSNGTVVATPAIYTIGECVATAAVIPVSESVAAICADGNQAFRKEVLFSDGSIVITFLGTDGAVIVPITWEPGACSDCDSYTETVICVDGVQAIKRTNNCTSVDTFISSDGTIIPTPPTYLVGECTILYEQDICVQTRYLGAWNGAAEAPPGTVTHPNFANSGEALIATTDAPTWNYVGGSGLIMDGGVQSPWNVTLTFAALHQNVEVNFPNVDGASTFTNIVPPPTSISGDGTLVGNTVTPTLPVSNITMHWDGPLSTISFAWNGAVGQIAAIQDISFDYPNPIRTWHKVVWDNGNGFTVVKTYNETDTEQFFDGAHILVNCECCSDVLICVAGETVIKRTDANGNITFIGTNGVEVAVPTLYTIGECTAAAATIPVNEAPIVFCDNNGAFLRKFIYDAAGAVSSVVDTLLDGTTIYVTVGTVGNCSTGTAFVETFICSANETLVKRTTSTGIVTYFASNGVAVPAPLTYTYGQCQPIGDLESQVLCDNNGGFLRFYTELPDGSIVTSDNLLDGVTGYTPVGTVKVCATGVPFVETFVCAAGVTLIKRTDANGVTTFLSSNGTVVAAPAVYTNGSCASSTLSFTESFICAAGVTLIKRTDSSGTNTFLSTNGAVVAAPVAYTNGACSIGDTDFFQEVLCDTVGSFIRRFVRDTAGTITVTNVALDGTTAYVPTGAVDVCKCTQTNPLIDSTLVRQTGVGAQTVLAGARSVTVTVITGNPTVAIGGGAAITLVPGLSLTWGVDQGGPAGESLQDAFVFTGIAGSDFFVHTTREI